MHADDYACLEAFMRIRGELCAFVESYARLEAFMSL